MKEDPLEHAWIAREGVLNFHFCIYGLDGPYDGGFYHGMLELNEEYPFAPPKLLFFTPSGRFEIDKPICTTFTNFHKETWTSSWNVRTMVMATISFMTSEEQGVGHMSSSNITKRQYANNSLEHNMKNPLFRQLFKKEIKELEVKGLRTPKKTGYGEVSSRENESVGSKSTNLKLYGLYLLLGLLLIIWVGLREWSITLIYHYASICTNYLLTLEHSRKNKPELSLPAFPKLFNFNQVSHAWVTACVLVLFLP